MFLEPRLHRPRAIPAAASIAVTLLLGLALLATAGPAQRAAEATMQLFDVTPPLPEAKPAPVPRPDPRRDRRKAGEAAPPNLTARATEIVAPPPIAPAPSPVIAAPVADAGAAARSGNAEVPGPGTGSGGSGDGRGSGGSGDGAGGGDDDGGTPPVWRRGRLKDSDYPRAAGEAGIGGTVGVRYLVGVDGRVSECGVTRSSGNAELDAVTCRLIRERFRFAPSRDGRGNPVPAWLIENHSWVAYDEPPARR